MKYSVLKHALTAAPSAKDFEIMTGKTPDCPDGAILVQVKYISLDPYVGTRLRGNHMGESAPEPGIGQIPGAIVGEVIETKNPRAKKGDHIHSMDGGWAEVVALFDDQFTIIDAKAAPLSYYIGVLGMPGLTAWAGVSQLARVHDGDVFAVNAAAGCVGGTAGQIARQLGAETVIGIAGGKVKCKLVEETYGFDTCVDYKTKSWQDAYTKAAPDGISVHFENVGQDQLTFAMSQMRLYGRGVLCGLAAHYHDDGPRASIPIGSIIGKRAALHGLVVYDFYSRWDEFRAQVAPWVADGKVKFVEDSAQGLKGAPKLMEKLMAGKNIGKCVVAL